MNTLQSDKVKKVVMIFMAFTLIFTLGMEPATAIEHRDVEQNETITASSKAIIIVPGVGGSTLKTSGGKVAWLYLSEDRLNLLGCSTSGISNETIVPYGGDYGVLGNYADLWDDLRLYFGRQYDVIFFPYDWRLSCSAAATKLATEVNKYDEVILVAHSMGGLVASKFLASSATNRSKVSKLITLGTPYTGAPHLLYVAETGDFNDKLTKLGFDPTIKGLVANFPCTYQLAPTERYSQYYGNYIKRGTTYYSSTGARAFYSTRPWAMSGNSTKPMYNTATSFHSSLLVSGTHIANSDLVDTYKIVGRGEDTASMIIYNEDGIYTGVEKNNAGDGTVQIFSASNNTALTASKIYVIDGVSHMGMLKNQTVFDTLHGIILGTTTTALDTKEYEVNEKGWLIDMDNKRIYVTVSGEADVTIFNQTGELIYPNVYDEYGDPMVDTVIVGGGRYKHCLRDGEYTFQINGNMAIEEPLRIEYQNDGYYVHSESYATISEKAVEVSVGNFDSQQVTVMATEGVSMAEEPVVILPFHVMTPEELVERNDF